MPDMKMTVSLTVFWPDGSITETVVDIDWLMGIIFTLKAMKEDKKVKRFVISG